MSELTRERIEQMQARSALCAEATVPGYDMRALVELALSARIAMDSRDIAESALIRQGYRKSCDTMACNCGDQWNHGGNANERLREISDALPFENGKTLLKKVEDLVLENETLRATIAQQAQELERVKQDVEKYKALLLQSCRDNIEDFKVQCKPKCDSYGHEDDCPAVYPGLVYDEMRQQLAAREAELAELKGNHCKDCCCARSWEALEVTGPTGMSIVEHIERLKAERDAAVQEAGRLREQIKALSPSSNSPEL